MDYLTESLRLHYKWGGKFEIAPRADVSNRDALSVAYTPGVAQPCLEISRDVNKSFELTGRHNLVAVITDGTAVLGLGDIGPEAGMPVMEGKCVLFKAFGGVDAIPLCLRTKDVDEIVNTVSLLAGSFGGINLEDISAPRCFEIEKRLKDRCDIPVFHDDQHGTAVVTLAALYNALAVTNRNIETVRIVVNGAGAAGVAVVKLLLLAGIKDVIMCDRLGTIHKDRANLTREKRELSEITNPGGLRGTLADALKNADVFIGVSAPRMVTSEMVKSMSPRPILFPMANPEPEIMPGLAISAGAAVVGTGRSDYLNQINNALAFPGIFRGALDVRATDINDAMKLAAAKALAELVKDSLSPISIIPQPFDPRVGPAVAAAVAKAARESGVARL